MEFKCTKTMIRFDGKQAKIREKSNEAIEHHKNLILGGIKESRRQRKNDARRVF
jgi:hypothetical protein